ncbi:MAG: flavodoxin [Acidaminobacter sp.]|uniref:flavodoxin n=1 Tax=Acidaminobacter sp. TaxID=1872102 RepID=UPI0013844F54|nr:flavodoxin [Acidaminobacter sp.]MZQ96271.1 flavodoxin [Acidaminobacter sp.]
MGKILIAYYSRKGQNYVSGAIKDLKVGNTAVAAEMLEALTGGDLFEIDTVAAYPLDYKEATEVAQKELRAGARPALTAQVAGMEDYDAIILGYPNWWGTMPMAVYTFLEAYDFSGKKILPFCTHEGSGLGRSEKEIEKLCPDAAVLKGLAIHGTGVVGAGQALEKWLKQAGIK